MNEMSLMRIMNSDIDFGKRILKTTKEIKKSKEDLINLADTYGEKYQEEIIEGTEKRNRMLTEGKSAGFTEEEIMKSYGKFVPTVATPILNLLYFLLRETDDDPNYGKERYQKRNRLDEQFGNLRESDFKSDVIKETPKMEEYLYGNITLAQFDILKKLKRLSLNNENEHEAFLAWKKCNELCEHYQLKFEKIPS